LVALAFVLSHLDYCSVILTGFPISTLAPLQRVQNATARLVLDLKVRDYLTSAYHQLHWLPVRQLIEYKLCLLTYLAVTGKSPAYLTSLLWFNVTIGRQRRHIYPSDKTDARRTSVLRRCSTPMESSTYWDLLYFEHWTIQAASEDVSL